MRQHLHAFFGRHHGGQGRGRFGGRFWGEGGPDDPGFGMGRKLSSIDLQLVILALLAEKPHHGYEIIKSLAERSHGFYSPSPGMVYPALTYLEELGHATVHSAGARKLYHITPAGNTFLQDRRPIVDSLLSQFDRVGRKMERMRRVFSGDGSLDEQEAAGSSQLWQARTALKAALHERRDASLEDQQRIADILARATEEIRRSASKSPKPE